MSAAAKIASVAVFVAVATAGLFGANALHGLRDGRSTARPQPRSAAGRVQGTPLAVPLRRAGTGADARRRLAGIAVEQRFVGSYLRFLQGSVSASALRYVSITARDEAISGGRVPADLRDGAVKLRSVQQTGATLYSAQATVVAANREASFAFGVSLIRERDGWWVSDVQPPDFDVAHPSPSLRRSPKVPAAARDATAGFARGYLRSLAGGRLPTMTPTARSQIRLGEDSLHGTRLPTRTTVRLVRLQYGPFEHGRFAVTVTASAAGRRLRFTLLMLRTRRGWECDGFL